MAKFAAVLRRTASATNSLGAFNCPASAMRRFKLYDVIHGSEGAVADNPFLYVWQRCTTAPTGGTAVTPQPLDPADAAAVTVAMGGTITGEPTYTAGQVVLDVPLNQRATYRWLAAPGGEIVIPATANNGIGCATPTSSAVAITCTAYIEEQ